METTDQVEGINTQSSFHWNGYHVLSWFLQDIEFYRSAISILKKRKLYDDVAWSYSFYHNDDEVMKEYITKSEAFKRFRGTFLETKTMQMLPKYKDFPILDYLPMVKRWVHKLGDDTIKALTNVQFRETYDRFLLAMTEKWKLNPFDKLIFISYLLIQDRIGEAKDVFNTIDPAPFETPGDSLLKLQFNYMQAYFDFYDGHKTGFKLAKTISKKYIGYPVITWRMKFQEILDQLTEVEEKGDEEEGFVEEKKADDSKKD